MSTTDLPHAMVRESRRHLRVPENTRLLWHIRNNGLVGEARVRNISTSGMRVELSSLNALPDKDVFSFDSNLNNANYIPDTARLVWRKKKRFSSDKYSCGFEFSSLPEVLASRLNKRVDDGSRGLVKSWKINRAISVFLSVVMVSLVGYAVWLGSIIFQDVSETNQKLLIAATQQADLTREYQRLYSDTTRRLADVTLELNETTALYHETQGQLASSRQELSVVRSVLSETESLLAQVQANGAPQAALTSGTVHNVQEGRALIGAYRGRIQEVAAQINQIKYENRLARVSALAERDRVRSMYGNQGFFVKSGQPVQVDMRRYEAATLNTLPAGKIPRSDSKVRVNVTVFQ